VLIRPDRIDQAELEELSAEAWLGRAPGRLAAEFLADHRRGDIPTGRCYPLVAERSGGRHRLRLRGRVDHPEVVARRTILAALTSYFDAALPGLATGRLAAELIPGGRPNLTEPHLDVTRLR
jgi:hypothetical protein